MRQSDNYMGWTIAYCAWKPITGQWVASRAGVNICTNSYDGLIQMILNRMEGEVHNAKTRN